MRAAVIVLLGLSLGGISNLPGQAPQRSKDVKYWEDKFTGSQYCDTKLGNVGRRLRIDVGVRKVRHASGTMAYLFTVERLDPEWAFVRGPSLWLVDGEVPHRYSRRRLGAEPA